MVSDRALREALGPSDTRTPRQTRREKGASVLWSYRVSPAMQREAFCPMLCCQGAGETIVLLGACACSLLPLASCLLGFCFALLCLVFCVVRGVRGVVAKLQMSGRLAAVPHTHCHHSHDYYDHSC